MCGEASGINYCIFPALLSAHGIFCLYLGRNSIRRKSPFCWIRNRYGAVLPGPVLPVAVCGRKAWQAVQDESFRFRSCCRRKIPES